MFRFTILVSAVVGLGIFVGVAAGVEGPMADAGLDQTVTVDTAVQLDGSGSSHPDGTLSSYEWTIRTPDGREIEPDCADCDRSQFTPMVVGRYAVSLTVRGRNGAQSNDTLFVFVRDAGPDVELSGQRSPDPDESVTYTASAESPDATLSEIAWAVEDDIVAVRPLDGSTDRSKLSLAFRNTETHRVQVVVRDSNGRTAYDQLLVRPRTGSTDATNWSETESIGCDDSEYAGEHPEECGGRDEPDPPRIETRPDPPDEPDAETFEVWYQTDGYTATPGGYDPPADSSYIGVVEKGVGLDGGDNAPWRQTTSERYIGFSTGDISNLFFGQEERTVTCEISGDRTMPSRCSQQVTQLESTGQTANIYSRSITGGYSHYGLTGGKRIRGSDPTSLEEGQKAKVTVVIQSEKDGLIDRSVDGIKHSISQIGSTVGGVFGPNDDADDSRHSSARADTSDIEGVDLIDEFVSDGRTNSPRGRTDSGDESSSDTQSSHGGTSSLPDVSTDQSNIDQLLNI